MKLEEDNDHQEKYDPNAPETEEDGLIAGQLRILKIKQHCKESKLRSQNLLQFQNGAPIHEKTVIIEVTDFKTYYKQQFQRDLLNFVGQIPIEGNKHTDRNEFNIQYFFLTPQYKYLSIIPQDRQGLFAVALFWTVLIDQIFYSNYRHSYPTFQRKTLYPKFIGNCTAPSLMSSECGHHQHPRKILQAINDKADKGNRFDFEREIFKKDESNQPRLVIDYYSIIEQARQVMKEEIKDYFENHQPEISWTEFWTKCEIEQ